MKTDSGKLIKAKKGFRVTLPTKKGSAAFPVPEAAVCFQPSDGEDGIEVEVQRDDANRIVKVTIPGKAEVAPRTSAPKNQGQSGRRGGPNRGNRGRGGQGTGGGGHRGGHGGGGNVSRRKLKKASPKALGLSFHNPYTFIPFTKVGVDRAAPTLQTADEDKSENATKRYTGILRLTVTTQSPMLTCDPNPIGCLLYTSPSPRD